MAGIGYESLLNNQNPAAYAATAYNTSTSLTDVSPVPQYTLAKGALFPGALLEFYGRIKFSNTSTPTLLLGIYHGGVAGTKLCAIGATTTTTAATNWPIEVWGRIKCVATALPSSSTLHASGFVALGTSLTAVTLIPMDASAIADVSVDTTTAKDITLGAQWGTNSASNTLQVIDWVVKGVNV